MPVVVRAVSPEDYDKWVQEQESNNMASSKGSNSSTAKEVVSTAVASTQVAIN